MVDAMRGHPENRPALERQRSTEGEKVLESLRGLVAAVGVKPMITQADAEADGHPVQRQRHQQVGPAEIEERDHSQDVEEHHDPCRDDIDRGQRILRTGRLLDERGHRDS